MKSFPVRVHTVCHVLTAREMNDHLVAPAVRDSCTRSRIVLSTLKVYFEVTQVARGNP
jgi:hypothetical protein